MDASFWARFQGVLGNRNASVIQVLQDTFGAIPRTSPPTQTTRAEDVSKALAVAIAYEWHVLQERGCRILAGQHLVALLASEDVDECIISFVSSAFAADQASSVRIHGLVCAHVLSALHVRAVESIGYDLKPLISDDSVTFIEDWRENLLKLQVTTRMCHMFHDTRAGQTDHTGTFPLSDICNPVTIAKLARVPLRTQHNAPSWTTAVAAGGLALEPAGGHIFLLDLPDQLQWYRMPAVHMVDNIVRTDKGVCFCILNEFTTCSVGKGDLVFASIGRSFVCSLRSAAELMVRTHLSPVTTPPGGLPTMALLHSTTADAQTQIVYDESAIGATATLPSDRAGGMVVQRAVPLLLTREHRGLIEVLAPVTAASGHISIIVVVRSWAPSPAAACDFPAPADSSPRLAPSPRLIAGNEDAQSLQHAIKTQIEALGRHGSGPGICGLPHARLEGGAVPADYVAAHQSTVRLQLELPLTPLTPVAGPSIEPACSQRSRRHGNHRCRDWGPRRHPRRTVRRMRWTASPLASSRILFSIPTPSQNSACSRRAASTPRGASLPTARYGL